MLVLVLVEVEVLDEVLELVLVVLVLVLVVDVLVEVVVVKLAYTHCVPVYTAIRLFKLSKKKSPTTASIGGASKRTLRLFVNEL